MTVFAKRAMLLFKKLLYCRFIRDFVGSQCSLKRSFFVALLENNLVLQIIYFSFHNLLFVLNYEIYV